MATLTLNRPIYVGFSVLDLSKLHTGSSAYAVQTEDIYRDMVEDAATHFDFNEYPLDHPLYSTTNRKSIGFFKVELHSVPMQQFVGLRPKCYAFLCTCKVSNNMLQHTSPVEKKTANGVKRRVKDAHLHFEYYLDSLKSFHTYLCRQNLIKSILHTVRTVHMCKVGLPAYDTKRWLRGDTSHTHRSPEYLVVNPNPLYLPLLSLSPSLPVPLSPSPSNQIASHDFYTYVAIIAIRTLLQRNIEQNGCSPRHSFA